MAHATFTVGDLTAVIGDNEAYGEHRAGYNGLHRLTHRTQDETLFVPTVAGMNLEHVFDGDQELRDVKSTRKVFFEPRNAPMKFARLSDREAELHQPPTPTFHLESWTRFRLEPPDAIDFTFRCRATQHVFMHGYIGLFWASYINAPEDKSMYLRDRRSWQQLCTQEHNRDSTVVPRDNQVELKFTPDLGNSLFQNVSPLRFDEPYFYGRFGRHVAIFMFEPHVLSATGPHLRLTHSPSGGGTNAERQTANPAWDWQFIIPKYDVKLEYGYRARLVYREACPRSEIQKAVADWLASLERK